LRVKTSILQGSLGFSGYSQKEQTQPKKLNSSYLSRGCTGCIYTRLWPPPFLTG